MALTIASVVFAAHRMAKTFDNVLEASATNYLFLFTQRTLTLRNEPPTDWPHDQVGGEKEIPNRNGATRECYSI